MQRERDAEEEKSNKKFKKNLKKNDSSEACIEKNLKKKNFFSKNYLLKHSSLEGKYLSSLSIAEFTKIR